jgi:hypothetical protein
MDWSKYSSLKSSKLASLGKEKQVTREAVSEVQDSDGKVVRAAQAKEEREYVAMSQKQWSAESGEAMDDSKREYSLSQLESEKARACRRYCRFQETLMDVLPLVVMCLLCFAMGWASGSILKRKNNKES